MLILNCVNLYLPEPLYKTCLHFKSLSKFSLVQYFWNLASKVLLSTIMVTCLLLYYSVLLTLATNQTLVVGHSVPFYLAATSLNLTISALPYQFLAVPYLVFVTTVGESFYASSTHPRDLLLFPVLYLSLGTLLSYPCIKLHHPGIFFSMVFRSKRFVTSTMYFRYRLNRKITLFYLCTDHK